MTGEADGENHSWGLRKNQFSEMPQRNGNVEKIYKLQVNVYFWRSF